MTAWSSTAAIFSGARVCRQRLLRELPAIDPDRFGGPLRRVLRGAARPAMALRVSGHRVEYPREIVDAMPSGLRLAFERSPSLIRSPAMCL